MFAQKIKPGRGKRNGPRPVDRVIYVGQHVVNALYTWTSHHRKTARMPAEDPAPGRFRRGILAVVRPKFCPLSERAELRDAFNFRLLNGRQKSTFTHRHRLVPAGEAVTEPRRPLINVNCYCFRTLL